MLQRWTNETDVVVGTLSACGRDREEFSSLLGYFLNPVALRLNFRRKHDIPNTADAGKSSHVRSNRP